MSDVADTPTLDLYERLPALYRLRDAEIGFPLRGLLALASEQARVVKGDLDGLWDDLFIETCADWVVPYVGDLVANTPLHPAAGRRRADVAKTIHYRRRKGTVAMLTELARDVTGWSAVVLPFFERLGWTQHLAHLRLACGLADLRDLRSTTRAHGAFDEYAHSVDVRRIAQHEGWHGIRHVGVFLWRLEPFAVARATARRAAAPNAHGYHVSPLGNPAPLFNDPGPVVDAPAVDAEARVAGPVGCVPFYFDLRDYADRYGGLAPADRPPNSRYYGPGRSIAIVRDGVPVSPSQVFCMDLAHWARPAPGFVALDVVRGRIAFPAGEEPVVGAEVAFHYGFSAPLGGGPYERRRVPGDGTAGVDTVAEPEALDGRTAVRAVGATPLADALAAWSAAGAPPTVIELEDGGTYEESIAIVLEGPELVIQAANRTRATLFGDVTITIPNTAAPERLSLVVDGLVIAGAVQVVAAGTTSRLLELTFRHCTLVPGLGLTEEGDPVSPGSASLRVAASTNRIRVTLDHCIAGPVRLPSEGTRVVVRDGILDALGDAHFALAADDAGAGPAGPVELERVTVLGATHVRELLASETIFTGTVTCERRQAGCVRYSWVPTSSVTPRRYRCQPELAAEKAVAARAAVDPMLSDAERDAIRADVVTRLAPSFTLRRYGLPAYGQLSLRCPVEIRTGAQDGAEMGAFESLKQPQREANLDLRLVEYLPFGLDAARIYVT